MIQRPLALCCCVVWLLGCGHRDRWLGSWDPLSEGGTSGASPQGGRNPAGLGGDGGGIAGEGGQAIPADRTRPFVLGADLSWVQEQEDQGLTFVENGVVEDVFVILRRHGFNAVRLRLFHDPSSPCRTSAMGDVTCGYQFEIGTRAEPYCDLAHTLTMARRVKEAGLELLLAFHYSDTWADPDDQNKPLAWEALDFTTLSSALETYTRDTLAAFVDAGLTPEMVQLGNEITPGFLFPDGSSAAGNFPRFAALLRAAIAGARAAAPAVPILLHLEKPDNLTTSTWWLDNILANGVSFDVLGQSCYPQWHGSSADWAPTFAALAATYPDLDFVVAEYSAEKRAVNELVFALPDSRGLGTYIWEPTGWGEALFDRNGDRLVANEWLGLYDEMAQDYRDR